MNYVVILSQILYWTKENLAEHPCLIPLPVIPIQHPVPCGLFSLEFRILPKSDTKRQANKDNRKEKGQYMSKINI